jgi:hypothetical protein
VADIAKEKPAPKQQESAKEQEGKDQPASNHASFSVAGPINGHTDELTSLKHNPDDAPEDPYKPSDRSFLTDEDVLYITGPRGWTPTIFAAVSAAAGEEIT